VIMMRNYSRQRRTIGLLSDSCTSCLFCHTKEHEQKKESAA